LQAQGVAVVGGSFLGVNTNIEMARIPPAAIADQVRNAAKGVDADLCFISCTAIRSAGLIADMEAELGVPVITSNQVMAWHALKSLNVRARVPGFGRLFDR
jgi:maleate cis-trans isomerase